MPIENLLELIEQGFDISFNYKDVFYTISLISDNPVRKYGIGSENGLTSDFESLEDIPDFVIDDKTVGEIIAELSEEEIFY